MSLSVSDVLAVAPPFVLEPWEPPPVMVVGLESCLPVNRMHSRLLPNLPQSTLPTNLPQSRLPHED